MKSLGKITIDSGAEKALNLGKSLLPAGVTDVIGDFERGDPVQISSLTGNYIAIGLSRYSSTEAKKLIGVQLIEIENILGYPARTALVHRDDMAK
jgi:glutamate 5-kinase